MSPRPVHAFRSRCLPYSTTSRTAIWARSSALCADACARMPGSLVIAPMRARVVTVSFIWCTECAYEHWHGMLFARFLAENQLLIEPQMGVAITLDECGELAKDEGVDQWMLAARFAHRNVAAGLQA